MTSLEGAGVLGLEFVGEPGPRPSSPLVCLVCSEPCLEEAVCSLESIFGMLISDPLDDCRPSSPKKPATFLYGAPLFVLVLESDV